MRIVFLNDVGFIGGAGIGLRRQVQSLLIAGHQVGVVCWLENPVSSPPRLRGRDWDGEWLGLHAHPAVHLDQLGSSQEVSRAVRDAVLSLRPDVVISGNLHWAQWPLATLRAIRDAGVAVVAYLHDCHWLTGRCAYTGTCTLFHGGGCNAECPTSDQYPALEPNLIAGAQAERRQTFTGNGALPMAANSRWTQRMAELAFGGAADVELIHLGCDTSLFSPMSKQAARRLLGLPQDDKFRVLIGAVDLGEERKGGVLLRRVLAKIAGHADIEVLAFGHNSNHMQGVRGVGNVTDERMMPILFGASDLFLNCATEESFGQTVLESSACAVPTVALGVGGLSDIIRHDDTGVLIPNQDASAFADAILALKTNSAARLEMGRKAREAVADHFSLEAQGVRWTKYLQDRLLRPGAISRERKVGNLAASPR